MAARLKSASATWASIRSSLRVHAVRRSRLRQLLILVTMLAIAPLMLSDYYVFVVSSGLILAVVVLGLYVVVGLLGEVSLAQATFMGVGGFGAMRLHQLYGFGILQAAATLTILSVPVAVLVALPALRVKASLLAISTLAVAVAADSFGFKQDRLWGGAGVSASASIPRPTIANLDFASDVAFYYLAAASFVAGYALVMVISGGKMGDELRAIRDSDVVAAARGIDVRDARLWAFIIASLYGVIGGVLFAYHQRAVSAISFDAFHGVTFAVLAVLGRTSPLAVASVAILYTVLPAALRDTSIFSATYTPLLFGVAVLVILRRQAHGRGARNASLLMRIRDMRTATDSPRKTVKEAA